MGEQCFQSESELVNRFLALLSNSSDFECVRIGTEFRHSEGATDILASHSGECLITFEAKLQDWRRALNQAYKNRSFADRSYVVLPAHVAENAIRHLEEFEVRGVGILSVGEGIQCHVDAVQREPIRSWLKSSAMDFLEIY